MRDIHDTPPMLSLADIFGMRSRVRLLRVLARSATPLTARQLAGLTDLTHAAVARALSPLVAIRLVSLRAAGRAYQYTLNREHYAYVTILAPAYEAERQSGEALGAEIREACGSRSLSLVLFGSVARGDHTQGSDIDVLAVVGTEEDRRRLLEQEDSLSQSLFSRFGMPLALVVTTLEEARQRPPFLIAAVEEGVLLAGKPLDRLLGA